MVRFPSRRRFAVTSLTLFRVLAVTLLLPLANGCGAADVEDAFGALPQTWVLTSGAQVATVVVSPFTNSGTFGETADSDGWSVGFGNCSVRLTVGGNVAKASPGDHWTFVTLGGGGCDHSILGTAEGTANGNFPDATQVNGTLSLSYQGPCVSSGSCNATNTANWTGVRIN